MKWKVWLYILLSYLLTFGLPIGVTYWRYAESYTVTVGGSFLYFIVAIIGGLLIKRITKATKKQKGNTRTVFKWIRNMIALTVVLLVTNYISLNFQDLRYVIASAAIGVTIGSVFEFLANKTNPEYAELTGLL